MDNETNPVPDAPSMTAKALTASLKTGSKKTLAGLAKAAIIVAVIAGVLLAIWDGGVVFYCFGATTEAGQWSLTLLFWTGALALTVLRRFYRYWQLIIPGFLLFPLVVYMMRDVGDLSQVWQQPWQRAPYCQLDGEIMHIKDVRDFRYRTENDYRANYVDLTLDLNLLEGVLLGMSYWDGHKDIAHTMLGFYFSDGQALVVSVETRKPVGAPENLLAGIFKQYGVIYVFGTAQDLWKLRQDYRKEDLYVYPTNATPDEARQMLLGLCNDANEQYENPQFYNTLTHNCTSGLFWAVRRIRPNLHYDLRMLLNGRADEYAYDNGWLLQESGDSFAEVKRRAKRVSRAIIEYGDQQSRQETGKRVLLDYGMPEPDANSGEAGDKPEKQQNATPAQQIWEEAK